MSDEFDWHAATADGDVVAPDQAAIACYTNPFGNVVLRQEGRYPEEDIWIVCQPIFVEALATALLRAAGLTDLVIVPVSQIEIVKKDGDMRAEERQNQKDRTAAAERKRRQRQRERDGKSNADESVTPAGPVTVTPESVTGRAKAEAPPTAPVTELNGAPSKQSTPPTELPEQKPPTTPPKATPASVNAYEEGKVAALQHQPAKPGYDPATEQYRQYMAGYHEVQGKQVTEGITKPAASKRDGEAPARPATVKPEAPPAPPKAAEPVTSGMRMTRADWLRHKRREEGAAAARAGVVSIQPRLFEEESEPQAHAR